MFVYIYLPISNQGASQKVHVRKASAVDKDKNRRVEDNLRSSLGLEAVGDAGDDSKTGGADPGTFQSLSPVLRGSPF